MLSFSFARLSPQAPLPPFSVSRGRQSLTDLATFLYTLNAQQWACLGYDLGASSNAFILLSFGRCFPPLFILDSSEKLKYLPFLFFPASFFFTPPPTCAFSSFRGQAKIVSFPLDSFQIATFTIAVALVQSRFVETIVCNDDG